MSPITSFIVAALVLGNSRTPAPALTSAGPASRAHAPGPEHARLTALVGTWDVELTFTFQPGSPPVDMIMPVSGDRADIKVATNWRNGVLTSVMSRKLVTGSKFDVQFSNLGAQYPFGFAAFDNAQVRHAVHYDAKFLAFAK